MRFCKIKSIVPSESKPIIHLTVEKNHNFFGNNLCLHNCGYRGELCIILLNTGKEAFAVKKGDRIAQMVVAKVDVSYLVEVDELNSSERGEGGFGSSGVR